LSIGSAKKKCLIASAAAIVAALAIVAPSFHGSPLASARDYEECVEALGGSQSSSPAVNEREASMTGCNAEFAGRRKSGGGYSYYDFMLGRSFDIAGPNPTAEERKHIDREYIQFLDAQRLEAESQKAKTREEQLRADLEAARQPVGPPLVLTPKNLPSPTAKRSIDQSKPARCDDDSMACGWLKLSAVVRDAFASSPKANPRSQ
jgi:hypothetical protein